MEFLDAREGSGHRVYVRSLSFVLYKATQDVFPASKLFIEHSLCRGYYCNFKKKDGSVLTDEDVVQIKQRMQEIINADRPIHRREVPTDGIEALRQAPVGRLVIDELFPAGLSEEDCDLLYRCHCLQIPRREIAASLGISLGACQMRLERAEERFRRLRDGSVAASRQGPPEKI